MSKETPCIPACAIDRGTEFCPGCGRALSEIARWHTTGSAERIKVTVPRAARMAAAGLEQVTTHPKFD